MSKVHILQQDKDVTLCGHDVGRKPWIKSLIRNTMHNRYDATCRKCFTFK